MRNAAGAGDGFLVASHFDSEGCESAGVGCGGCAFAVNAQHFCEMRGADTHEEFSAKCFSNQRVANNIPLP